MVCSQFFQLIKRQHSKQMQLVFTQHFLLTQLTVTQALLYKFPVSVSSYLTGECTETPYFAENDFWRQVFRSSAQRPGPAFYSFGKTKVCHLENKEAQEPNVSVVLKFGAAFLAVFFCGRPECSRGGRWEGSQVSDLCIWGLVNGGTQMSALSGRRKSVRVVHCKWRETSVSMSESKQSPAPPEFGGLQLSPEPSDSSQVREHLSSRNILHHHVKVWIVLWNVDNNNLNGGRKRILGVCKQLEEHENRLYLKRIL